MLHKAHKGLSSFWAPVGLTSMGVRAEGRRRQWQPTPVLLPGKSHGRRSLVAAVHGVARSWTRLSDFTFTFHFHALKKEMATHSNALAWRIPGTGEPGGLPSMGSHRVGHNWHDLAAAAARDVVLSRISHVWLCATLWTVAHQAPLTTGFSRQGYWSGLPFPFP